MLIKVAQIVTAAHRDL